MAGQLPSALFMTIRRFVATWTMGLALVAPLTARQSKVDEWRNTPLNNRPDRWEGIGFPMDVGDSQIELVSLVGGGGLPPFAPGEKLRVRFYVSALQAVRAVAQERELIRHYLMQVKTPTDGWKQGWNSYEGWSAPPTEHVLRSNLGVVISTGPGPLAPAFLSTGSARTVPSGRYEVAFRPGVSAAPARIEVRPGCGLQMGPKAVWAQRTPGRLYDLVPFSVTVDLSAQPAGEMTLRVNPSEVGANKAASDTPQAEHCFHHQVPGP
jgi:hypothetical protein